MLEDKYFEERIQIMEQCRAQEFNKVPEWAHAEHMEMSTLLKEL